MLLVCLVVTKGSKISLTSHPGTIKPVLTQALTLRCSLNDTTVASPSGGLVGRRDVMSTADNVQALISLVVLRNGLDLASISSYSSGVTVLGDVGLLNATGSIPGEKGEKGYIELTWSYPGEAQSGNYSCEANGITTIGHTVRFLTSLQMPVKNPGLSDLIQYVHDRQIKDLDMEAQRQKQQAQIQDVQDKNTNLTQIVNTQHTQMQDMQREQVNMQHLLNISRHMEDGTTDCGRNAGIGSWQVVGGYQLSPNVTVTFTDVYKDPPMVMLNVGGMNFRNYIRTAGSYGYSYVEYHVDLVEVNADSFVYRCRIRQNAGSYSYQMNSIDVNWHSFSRG